MFKNRGLTYYMIFNQKLLQSCFYKYYVKDFLFTIVKTFYLLLYKQSTILRLLEIQLLLFVYTG